MVVSGVLVAFAAAGLELAGGEGTTGCLDDLIDGIASVGLSVSCLLGVLGLFDHGGLFCNIGGSCVIGGILSDDDNLGYGVTAVSRGVAHSCGGIVSSCGIVSCGTVSSRGCILSCCSRVISRRRR